MRFILLFILLSLPFATTISVEESLQELLEQKDLQEDGNGEINTKIAKRLLKSLTLRSQSVNLDDDKYKHMPRAFRERMEMAEYFAKEAAVENEI